MECYVNYLLTDETLSWDMLSTYLGCIPEPHRPETYAFERDKIHSLLAQLLLQYEAKRRFGSGNVRVERTPLGKPYWPQFPDVQFSLSHTDGCVAVAVGTGAVGVDVEKIASADLRIADRFFTPREAQWIRENASQRAAFYEIWTKKEAYLKMRGTGLTASLRTFDVLDRDLAAQIETRMLPAHVLSVCCAPRVDNVQFHQMELRRLLLA